MVENSCFSADESYKIDNQLINQHFFSSISALTVLRVSALLILAISADFLVLLKIQIFDYQYM